MKDIFYFKKEEYLLTIFITTRKRVKGLIDTINSFMNLANSEFKNFEFIVKVDFDDHETIKFIPEMSNDFENLNFIINSRKEGYPSIYEGINKGAGMARGKYMLALPDDCLMTTPNWNEKLENILKEFKIYFLNYNEKNENGEIINVKDKPEDEWMFSRHFLGKIGVNFHDFVFPIFPTKLEEIWGFITPHTLADNWLGDIAKRSSTHPWSEDVYEFIEEVSMYLETSLTINSDEKQRITNKVYDTYRHYINDALFFDCANKLVEYKKWERYHREHKLNVVNDFLASGQGVAEYFNLP